MATPSILEKALQTWQPYYEQELTPGDAEEIISNWGSYIELLSEWTLMLHEKGEEA